VPLLNQGKE
jgi:hypothetical protein